MNPRLAERETEVQRQSITLSFRKHTAIPVCDVGDPYYPKTHLAVKLIPRRALSGNVSENLIRAESRPPLADDYGVQILTLATFHAAAGSRVSRAQCSSCVADFTR
jgi:hypothetical protein